MTRGDEDIEGGLRKFLDTRKGGSEKIRGGSENLCISKPTGGGAPKKLNRYRGGGGVLKFQASSFPPLPLCHIK